MEVVKWPCPVSDITYITSERRPGPFVLGAIDATSANRLSGSSEYVLRVFVSNDEDKRVVCL